jgi:hypothetical protein
MNGSSNVPLMATVARQIIVDLFSKRDQWKRADLAEEVVRIHRERGGITGKQDPKHVTQNTLRALEEDGMVQNIAYGMWRWIGPHPQNQSPEPEGGSVMQPEEEGPGEEIVPERQLGEGPECVYVYFNPNDRKLAEHEGRDTWECKIGYSTKEEAQERILSQGCRTALSHVPILGLLIRTQDGDALEKILHASLRILARDVEDSPGTEWFMTSPAHIEAWFGGYQTALDRLKGGEKQPDPSNGTGQDASG